METPRELPIVGGHLALDFANTVDDPRGPARHDHAATWPDVLVWAGRVGLVAPGESGRLQRLGEEHPRRAAGVVRRGRLLRDALNDLFGAVVEGEPGVAEPWSRLRPFVVAAYAAAEVVPSSDAGPSGPVAGRLARTWGEDLGAVLHPVAVAAADLLVADDLERLKRCGRCPWLFLDRSKNHSRRWCDMDDCGRAQKIERYVARRRAARRS